MKSEWLMLTETMLRSLTLLHSSENNTPLVLPGSKRQIICCEHASLGIEMCSGRAGLLLFTGSLICCTLNLFCHCLTLSFVLIILLWFSLWCSWSITDSKVTADCVWLRREHALGLPWASKTKWKPLGKCSTEIKMPYLCLLLNELATESFLMCFIYSGYLRS